MSVRKKNDLKKKTFCQKAVVLKNVEKATGFLSRSRNKKHFYERDGRHKALRC